ncbi:MULTISPECIES: LysR family transcriptional regulator [Rhizobiaceae]|uniref:DNA-binding transcriptional LysR family regulator n=1 Tax=Aliirhizobium cellulosilyticum TaxID=393664 RepID=A0A7W6S6B1_9HYPH|nr:LysR family transcriptional regulator [Rhizobium cellulosilyticum]MBB4347172.1 DNA-binding transcriptional LysR family regulator [Rhizobium cellulosilyticum]MBB4410434.1 DNA-binding transcriptional LysR family regulator [Rhizobium cellulosilyticum]MBB4445121.1 DNA-binding transcriptional LysR family regulator [Rhizobium cellulosilyticum]
MTTIDHFNLRSFDLNLLVAFDALISEGSVTKAAKRLKIQQPAMSHSLSTLRVLLQDELFIRVGQVMQPTSRARSLAVPVRQALKQAQLALSGGDAFDPSTEERTFRIAMSPEVELLLIPDLTARLRRLAPGIRVLARVFPYEAMDPSLEDGSIDLAVGCTYTQTSRRSFETLYKTEFACCHNPDLLTLSKTVGLEAYLAAEHATISQNETLQGCIKDALEIAGVELNVVTAAPGYMSVLSAAQSSPLIATVPSRIAERYAPLLGLDVSPLPVSLSFPPVNMVWANHADGDPANAWLRQQIRDVFASSGVLDDDRKRASQMAEPELETA